MRKFAFLVPALLFASGIPARAQNQAPAGTVYRVEFRIRDGSAPAGQSARRYAMLVALVDGSGHGSFRVGDRVPVATGSFQSGGNTTVNTQFNYIDVGVNIDTRLNEREGKLVLNSTLDLSGVMDRKPGVSAPAPTIGQIKIVVDSAIVPGKPALVASIDDPVTLHRLDVEALVTKE